MKKLTIFVAVLFILGSFASAAAIDRTGTFAIGGHFGYSFGFGEAFKEIEWGQEFGTSYWGFRYENEVTYSFWGNIKYCVSPKFALTGIVDYQAGDVNVNSTFGDYTSTVSESYNWTSVLGNAIFSFNPDRNTSPYFTFGGGVYFNDDVSEPGINVGGGLEHFFQDNLALDVGTRYHMIFTDPDNTNYVSIYGGINYYFGMR